MTAVPDQPSRSPFIADQRLLRLRFRPEDRGEALPLLRVNALPQRGMDGEEDNPRKDRNESRWEPLPVRERLSFLGGDSSSGQRRLLCVTAAAGIGKSMALEQLDAAAGAATGSQVVIWTHFSDLPDDWESYVDLPHDGKRHSFFVQRLKTQFAGARKQGFQHLPRRIGDEDAIRDWVLALLRCGQLILAVDGLDEVPEKPGIAKAKQLREFLRQFPRAHCVVGGRPNAITQILWQTLFSRSGKESDASSDWKFALTDLFDDGQVRRALGPERHDQLRFLQGEVQFSGRTIEVLRSLDIETFATLRSLADVYWHGIQKSLEMDSIKEGGKFPSWMTKEQLLILLAAIGVTILMWNRDPHFTDDNDGLPSDLNESIPIPVESDSTKTSESIEHVVDIQELYRRVCDRLSRIHSEWSDLKQIERLSLTKDQIRELVRLNTSYLECSFFRSQDPKRLEWRNVTQRDFFAALWMVNGASDQERAWFHERIDQARDARDTSIAEAWRMVCGMPSEAFALQGKLSNQRWLHLIRPLYQRPDEEWHRSGRPTELMYRCWANLLRRAGFLTTASWSDEDLMWATTAAQHYFYLDQPGDLPSGVTMRDRYAWVVVGGYLREYVMLRKTDPNALTITNEDLETAMRDCNSLAGKQVRVGRAGEKNNVERDYTLPYRFTLCAYAVTNRLYDLFDEHHSSRFGKYTDWSPYPRGPVVNLSWYDSMVFSIWSHSMLPNEWIWEYSSRAESRNPSGGTSRYYWGDEKTKLGDHAWIDENSSEAEDSGTASRKIGEHAHSVGQKTRNDFGLYDTLGNVWEWCMNRYESEEIDWGSGKPTGDYPVARVLRGGSFGNGSFDARCSFRSRLGPSYSVGSSGCRVARAHYP
ncbi:SUMF1/EgtB/PvdO family nonheme iron enzyme [Stieleria varia]|uniref:Serine/threonine-protein kinase pkn1 n=1 Tax=Stieleria varia TaxID=2528005 RepID=A0A5C5ZNY8_9BACT|nr:SUMF1/EgtB/PvdO family nonheme iron enzyme [Stieleria varia]TWT89169.1 Serine/threonine-protein kinase pkn1 [Stieleria varia]